MSNSSGNSRSPSNTKLGRDTGKRHLCLCGFVARVYTAWNETDNAGRRFYGCPNYQPTTEIRKEKGCRYLHWIDDEFCDRAKAVIKEIRDKEKRKELELERKLVVINQMEEELAMKEAEIGHLKSQLGNYQGHGECASKDELAVIVRSLYEIKAANRNDHCCKMFVVVVVILIAIFLVVIYFLLRFKVGKCHMQLLN